MKITRDELLSQDVVNVSDSRDEVFLANGYSMKIVSDSFCCAYQDGQFYKNGEDYELNEDEDDDYSLIDVKGEKLNIVIEEYNNGYYSPCAELHVYDNNNNRVQVIELSKF